MKLHWFKIYDFKIHGADPQLLYSVRTVDVNGQLICLGRLPEGYFAVSDKCPHADGRLGIGQCTTDGKVICPYHRYKYDLKTGQGDERQGDFVRTFPIETRTDGVYIGFQSEYRKPWWKLWS